MMRTLQLLTCTAVVLLSGTAIAQAYWLTTGAGSGSASAGTMTISAEASSAEPVNSTLYPGGTADAVIKLHNPNPVSVQVVAITAPGVPQAANGCSPTGVSFIAPANPQFSLPANQSTVLHLAGAMAMDATSASACQGQAFSLPVTVTVQK